MYALKCKELKFTVKDESGQERVEIFKKWTNVLYKILELEPYTFNFNQ